MTSRTTTIQNLRQSFLPFFDGKKPIWPNPEDSIGKPCSAVGGFQCWQAIGPAQKVLEELSLPIAELFEKHLEALEEEEPKPRAISFEMWMIGPCNCAYPAIIISSRSQRQRTLAKALLKKSQLLAKYPGIKIKTLDKMPAIHQAGEHTIRVLTSSVDKPSAYVVNKNHDFCGASISYRPERLVSRLATMGGLILVDGVIYGLSAQHVRFDAVQVQEDATDTNDAACFDEDSDIEDEELGDPEFVEITRKGELCSANRTWSG